MEGLPKTSRDMRSVVLDAVPSMLAYWDRDLRCHYANRAYERWFSIDPAGLIGTSLRDLLGEETFALNEPHILAALRGETQTFERTVPSRDGSARRGLACYVPDIVEGEIVGFTAHVTEISELHAARTALAIERDECRRMHLLLKTSEAALRQSQALGQIGSWQWEIDADIVIWSDQLYTMFGLDRSRLPPNFAGQEALHTAESWRRLQSAIARLMNTGIGYTLELEYVRADGSTGWMEARGAAERGPDGRIIGLNGTVLEITGRRLSRLALRRGRKLGEVQRLLRQERLKISHLEKSLTQAQKLEVLGTLAGGIAHDFNNVLAVVSGALYLLQRKLSESSSLELVTRGLRAVDRATRLIRQLMGFARTQAIDVQVTDVAELIRSSQELIKLSVGPRFRVNVDAPSPCLALVDPNQLEVAVLNLAINSRDAMSEGGTLLVSVCAEPVDGPAKGRVLICVQDDGAGMSAETLVRAREPFFTTKPVGVGTGLGLAMVHAFAQRMSGSFDLQSSPGAGTRATLVLPAAPQGIAPLAAEPDSPIERSRHGNARILIVDDDPLLRPVLVQYLVDLGYEVHAVEDGRQALGMVEHSPPFDLVLTDVAMHGIDGLKLAKLLRARQPTLPILLITGSGGRTRLVGEEVLAKPFSQSLLARHVLGLLGRATPMAARISGRIKDAEMRALYETWTRLRAGQTLPTETALAWSTSAGADHVFLVEAVGPQDLRRTYIGAALRALAGQALEVGVAMDGSDAALGGLEAAYHRCVMRREPVYEYMRFRLEDGQPVTFERLLLPCSKVEGTGQQLVGMAKFVNLPIAPIQSPRTSDSP